jgi:hypothetical protein
MLRKEPYPFLQFQPRVKVPILYAAVVVVQDVPEELVPVQ